MPALAPSPARALTRAPPARSFSGRLASAPRCPPVHVASTQLSRTGGRVPDRVRLGAAAAADAPTSLTPNRDRYHVIELAGCELLVASTPDGRLDVGDAYVRDGASGLYARPGGGPGDSTTPSALAAAWGGPRPAVVVPWETTFFGDALFKKAGWTRMDRVFLIPALSVRTSGSADERGPRSTPVLDFTAVAAFDAATRVLELADVKREAPEGVDPSRLSLRIRSEGLILVETDALPTPNELVAARRGA